MSAEDDPGWATAKIRASRLDPAVSSFYHAILRAFPALGGPPEREWLESEAAEQGLGADAALAALAAADVMQRNPATGAITAAYPFSGVPTPHVVTLAGGRPVYSMCAIDALGIPFMFDQDATVVSRDPQTDETITIHVRDGTATWAPADAIVFFGTVGDEGLTCERLCPTVNFFASAESAEAYKHDHPQVSGHILDHDAAVRSSIRSFGDLFAASGPAGCEPGCCRCQRAAAA